MINNPYDVLNIPRGASRAEVEEAYRNLGEQYRRDRFESGSRGEEAAEKLQQLEIAYNDIIRQLNFSSSAGDSSYDQIKELIRKGDYEAAQNLLDDTSTRDAEWHYIQSTVFFKKSWFLEAKKQLEFAVNMEPNNDKYKEALDRLNKYLASNTISPDQLRTTTRPTQDMPEYSNGTCTGSCCGDMCLANMCANCLCGGCR